MIMCPNVKEITHTLWCREGKPAANKFLNGYWMRIQIKLSIQMSIHLTSKQASLNISREKKDVIRVS